VLEDIALRLESNSEECWQALEGLAILDAAASRSLIEALSALARRPGVETLLLLLSAARHEETRSLARSALQQSDRGTGQHSPLAMPGPSPPDTNQVHSNGSLDHHAGDRPGPFPAPVDRDQRQIVHSVVTPVDGNGRGSVGISVRRQSQRRTAMFLCDVQRGVLDVVGEVEPDSDRAGRLLDDLLDDHTGSCAADVPELTLGLLAGSLMLGGDRPPRPIRDWIDGTLGPDFQPAAFPASIAGWDSGPISSGELTDRVRDVFDACPSWLDDSALAQELAEEIWLREGRVAADPDRDAGAYRFLFEHRLIRRLELYQRMLLWMGWLWSCSGQAELSRSALALAGELSDDQYAVPSHPFHVELTTRSLMAAQVRMHAGRENRPPPGRP
jgi:hypothetical protein